MNEEEIYRLKYLSYITKNNLVGMSQKELLNHYKQEVDYHAFLGKISFLLEQEVLFFLSFPKVIDHTLEVINQKRFEFQTNGSIRQVENEMIVTLNQYKTLDSSKYKKRYCRIQQMSRMYSIVTDEELLYVVATDALVIKALEKNNLSFLDRSLFSKIFSRVVSRKSRIYRSDFSDDRGFY